MTTLIVGAVAAFLLWRHGRGASAGSPGASAASPASSEPLLPAGTLLGYGAAGNPNYADGKGGMYGVIAGVATPRAADDAYLLLGGKQYIWHRGPDGIFRLNPNGVFAWVPTASSPGNQPATAYGDMQPPVPSDTHAFLPVSVPTPRLLTPFTPAVIAPSGPVLTNDAGLTVEQQLGVLGLPAGGVAYEAPPQLVPISTVPTTMGGFPTIYMGGGF